MVARARMVLLLIAALLVAATMASGPAAAAADAARPRCRAGYKVQRKRGVWRCVRRPREPRPPRDAVTPSSIELIVAKVEGGRFSATGYMEFSQKVTGTAYGHWLISNGVARERLPFRLGPLKDLDYTPFTIGYPIAVHISGRTVTATLVIGRTRSNSIVAMQPDCSGCTS